MAHMKFRLPLAIPSMENGDKIATHAAFSKSYEPISGEEWEYESETAKYIKGQSNK